MKKIRALFTARRCDFLGFLVAFLMVVAALSIQHLEQIKPCPLCVIERMVVFFLAIFFLIAVIHRTGGRWWQIGFHGFGALLAMVGMLISGRHVWLQYFAPKGDYAACGPDLRYMLEHFPLQRTVEFLLHSNGNCATVDKVIFNVSLSGWAFAYFFFACIICLSIMWMYYRKRS